VFTDRGVGGKAAADAQSPARCRCPATRARSGTWRAGAVASRGILDYRRALGSGRAYAAAACRERRRHRVHRVDRRRPSCWRVTRTSIPRVAPRAGRASHRRQDREWKVASVDILVK
jgi:hypothetical protein